jgi:hypothetical protein
MQRRFVKIFSLLLCLYFTCSSAATPSTAFRLQLSRKSTLQHLQYFRCDITPDQNYQTGIKVPPRFTRVIMVNFGQMMHKFNGLGILDTTAEYVNSYTFASYNDTGFKHLKRGFVDVFVAWPSYKVNCFVVKKPSKKRPLAPVFG